MTKLILLFILISLTASFGFSQKNELKKSVKELNDFMDNHIPEGVTGVKKYQMSVMSCTLDKETILKEGEPHHKYYNLDDAVISVQHFSFGDSFGGMDGDYESWDVVIDKKWILNGFHSKEEAEQMVVLLTNVQSLCNK